MVTRMNKKAFIDALAKEAKLSIEDATLVNEILEENFFISKKNKDKIVSKIVIALNMTLEEASNIYDIAKEILKTEISQKLKHPFRSQD